MHHQDPRDLLHGKEWRIMTLGIISMFVVIVLSMGILVEVMTEEN